MGTMKRAARIAVFVLCVAFTVASIVNVFGDNAEVELLAKEVACAGATAKPLPVTAPPGTKPGDPCAMTVTRASRTPFGQSFDFSGKSGTRHISCTRSLILAGSYSCAAE